MVALRLASEGCDDRVEILRSESSVTRDDDRELTQCLRGIILPSREVLMTLLWAVKVEERKTERRVDLLLDLESRVPSYSQPKIDFVELSGTATEPVDGRSN